jgi:hypothetical protein
MFPIVPPREQQPPARVRLQRRHADRPVQQVRVQRRAIRPYPAKASSNRITNEGALPEVKASGSPLLTRPNEISEKAWQNWVQERGLYFLAEDKDLRYEV